MVSFNAQAICLLAAKALEQKMTEFVAVATQEVSGPKWFLIYKKKPNIKL